MITFVRGLVPCVLLAGLLAGCASPAQLATEPDQAAGSAVALATQPTVADEAAAVARNKVQVNFGRGGAGLNQDAQRNLDVAARLFRDAKPVLMFVAGHSDGLGDEYGNLLLSARRAEVVKQALVARGIPPGRLLLQAYGESEPADSQDAQAADNRRVVITWRLL